MKVQSSNVSLNIRGNYIGKIKTRNRKQKNKMMMMMMIERNYTQFSARLRQILASSLHCFMQSIASHAILLHSRASCSLLVAPFHARPRNEDACSIQSFAMFLQSSTSCSLALVVSLACSTSASSVVTLSLSTTTSAAAGRAEEMALAKSSCVRGLQDGAGGSPLARSLRQQKRY